MSIRSSWLIVLFKPTMSWLIICLLVLSITERVVLKFLTTIMIIFSCNSLFWFHIFWSCLNWAHEHLGLYPWLSNPVVIMSWPSLSLVIFPILKSVLSDTIISLPSFLMTSKTWCAFFHLFAFNLFKSLYSKYIFCGQHITGSCLFIHSDNLCLLTGLFRLFTFSVI